MQAVIDSFPKSEYVRDAHLEIARAWEKGGEKEKAAAAYVRFAERYPGEKGAADAWLKAADLYAAAGKDGEAQKIRLAYIKRYPNDVETAMEVYEGLALQELKTVGPDHPVSIAAPRARQDDHAQGQSRGREGPGGQGALPPPRPPTWPSTCGGRRRIPSSRPTRFSARWHSSRPRKQRPSYEALRIRQPLPPSIAAKQKSLDRLMGLYKQSVDQGAPEWAHASTFRIGEALMNFGDALEKSERPHDLTGDGLNAYEDVLFERAHAFGERGENVWSDLLKRTPDAKDDPWIARAQGALWQRLGDRFGYRPETDYPLVNARAADKKEPAEDASGRARAQRPERKADPEISSELGARTPPRNRPSNRPGTPKGARDEPSRSTDPPGRAALSHPFRPAGSPCAWGLRAAGRARTPTAPTPRPAVRRRKRTRRPSSSESGPEAGRGATTRPRSIRRSPTGRIAVPRCTWSRLAGPRRSGAQAALARDPAYLPALMLLSKLYYDAGRNSEGVSLLEAARTRTGAFPDGVPQPLLAGLALHYEALGRHDQAEAVVSDARRARCRPGRDGAGLRDAARRSPRGRQ